jgi:hypothetical protein
MAIKPLTPIPSRTDLTDRECSEIIGGTIAALCRMSEVENVHKAIKWWADQKAAWGAFANLKERTKSAGK